MNNRVGELTTKIVGPQEQYNEADHAHAKAPRMELGQDVYDGYTTESHSPFYRMCFPRSRGRNSLTRTLVNYTDGPINPKKQEVTDPEHTSEIIKEVARFLGADRVGICKLDKAYVYSHQGSYTHYLKGGFGDPIDLADHHQYAISMVFKMDPELLKASPGFIASAVVCKAYTDAAVTGVQVAQYIREIGYSARAHFCLDEQVIQPPLGVMAGLGELGRCGYLLTPDEGPAIRLGTVTTDLPLATDQPVDYGIARICEVCKKCANCCPSQALTKGEQEEMRGAMKWPNDQERCIQFWVTNHEKYDHCDRCIVVCPLNKPNTWWHKLGWFFAVRSRLLTRFLVWLDDVIWGKNPQYKVKWLDYKFPDDG